ncbi:MAG: hypothetical protein WC736_13435 [Gallionella sp.]|jgi:hypothetical protein
MDEHAYRQVLASTPCLCPFEKALLSGCVACSQQNSRQIAERVVLGCHSAVSQSVCVSLRDAFRQNFTFALGRAHIDGPLPHAQEMRMQCGGLKGLQQVLSGCVDVSDVAELILQAKRNYGELEQFPFMQIVHASKTSYRYRASLVERR